MKERTKEAGKRDRRSISETEHITLMAQVDSCCPLCGDAILYTKKGRTYKQYDVAHIFPLNPTPEEQLTLSGVKLLSKDVNHIDNLIPLCLPCHEKFDKPRTASEYNELAALKRSLLEREHQQKLQFQYKLQDDIRAVVDALHTADLGDATATLAYDPKTLESKLANKISRPAKQKIVHNVADYFQVVKAAFQDMEKEDPGSVALISSQVKTYYLAQKHHGVKSDQIFPNLVDWIRVKTKASNPDAPEIIVSFFIQNCEVFE